MARADALLGTLERGGSPSQGLLFFGPRGNGKTSLLDRIADDARRRGLRAEELAVSCFAGRAALIRRLQEKVGLTGVRLKDLSVAGVGVSVQPGSPGEDAAELLARWITGTDAPLVILLDEAHTVPPGTGRLFFNAVQSATRQQLPFLLVVAGTPDAPRRIRKAGTFTERMFEQIRVGRLEREATLRALRGPASDSGLPLDGDAASLLAAESQDYPYFIQLLGSAAWTAAHEADAREIAEPSAQRGIAAIRARFEQFYAERFDEACGRKIEGALIPLARHLRDRGGRLSPLEYRPLLAEIAADLSLPGDEIWLRETLSDLGVVWRTPAGWEMGIPSFGDYLLSLHAAGTGGD